jgi:hemin uptake protein HemP
MNKTNENKEPLDNGPVGNESEILDSLRETLPKIIPFRQLCRCGDEVWIENEGQLYRLRRTKQGKLILTK